MAPEGAARGQSSELTGSDRRDAGKRIRELIMCPLVKCYPYDPSKRRVRKWVRKPKRQQVSIFLSWGRAKEQMEAR